MGSQRGRPIARRHSSWRRGSVALIAVLGASGLVASALAAPGLRLVSAGSDGTPANDHSNAPVPTGISADGKLIAFQSSAANLPGGNGATDQIYVRNVATGKTRLASKNRDGDPSGSHVQNQGISANGRYVAFQSTGTGLPGANGQTQAWVHDLETKRTTIVSRTSDGEIGNAGSSDPSLSADGGRVVFASDATNLPGGNAAGRQIYVRDLGTDRTKLVSRDKQGEPATGDLYGQTISANGNRVAFYSTDDDLPGGNGVTTHVYVRDLKGDSTLLADRDKNGQKGNDSSYNASIAGDGKSVIFESQATNFPGQTGNQMYVRDLPREKTILVGRNSQGEPQDGYAEFGHLNANGRYAQFVSPGDNLPGGDAVDHSLVYVRDLRQGKTRLVSRTPAGEVPTAQASTGSISLDGRWVVFESGADNLGGDPSYVNVFRVGPLG